MYTCVRCGKSLQLYFYSRLLLGNKTKYVCTLETGREVGLWKAFLTASVIKCYFC